MNNFFCAENLYRKFEGITIDLSIFAKENSMTVLLGKSGSGKSTVLRLISGLETLSEREDGKMTRIILNKNDITNLAPRKRNVGMVFQSHALFPNMNVIENVAYGLRCNGTSKKDAQKKAKELLERFDLYTFENRKVETLSGGEAQRVSLARTLITNPSLILFDEPLSSLDAPLRKQLAEDIKKRQKQMGFTGIFVTHDIQEAKMLADTIIFIKDGKKIWEGRSENFSENIYA